MVERAVFIGGALEGRRGSLAPGLIRLWPSASESGSTALNPALYVIRLFASGGLAAKYRLMPFMIALAILSR